MVLHMSSNHQMIASYSPQNNQALAIPVFESHRGHRYEETWPEFSILQYTVASRVSHVLAGIQTPLACIALYQRAI